MAFAALCGALAARAGRATLSGTGWLICGGAVCGALYFLALFALGSQGVRELRARPCAHTGKKKQDKCRKIW